MKITGTQRLKKHLYSVSLDNGGEITLDKDIFEAHSLHPGQEISTGEAAALIEESDFQRAYSRALWYLDNADQSEKGLYFKLTRAGFSKEAAAAALARLKEHGLIDDARFSGRIAERLYEKNISKRQIFAKLLEKGVPKDIAGAATEALPDDELSQIYTLIEKKYSNKLSDRESTEKVFAALVRRGFGFSAVREALRKYNEKIKYYTEEDI